MRKKCSTIKIREVIKSQPSNKLCAKEQIHVVEKREILKTDIDTSEVFFKILFWKYSKKS